MKNKSFPWEHVKTNQNTIQRYWTRSLLTLRPEKKTYLQEHVKKKQETYPGLIREVIIGLVAQWQDWWRSL